ncbi:MAG: SDR family oxidoreductase [Mesorhizobium sp.]
MFEQPRSALVTGGARRLGAAIVRDLAAHGFAVAIHHNTSAEDAATLAREITDLGGTATTVQADLSKPADVDRVIAQATQAIGPLGLLVNSASVFEPDSLLDFSADHWDANFDVHLKAPVMLARRFAEQLGDERTGLVVNVIDQRVLRPNPNFFTYTLSKSALWEATRIMALALAPKIRVNAIGPGPALPNARQAQSDFDRQVEGLILKRGPDIAEFGRTVRYLFEMMSVTGQMIAIDGGQHLAWQTPDVTGMAE